VLQVGTNNDPVFVGLNTIHPNTFIVQMKFVMTSFNYCSLEIWMKTIWMKTVIEIVHQSVFIFCFKDYPYIASKHRIYLFILGSYWQTM